ncbi:hypothetical protein QOZ80_1BG0093440 [Eleusine coracana subsp. coracana]|nr:hypothetical protein QOZ80_1BG0093440 [Eleusine coracana subsp. coracana]
MEAAVGNAAEDLGGAAEMQAAARLASAEHAILQRNPIGIWDADGNCNNRVLLAAVDEVLLLADEDPFPEAASSARRQLDTAVAAAVSRMVDEFLRVRVWDGIQLRAAFDWQRFASSGSSPIASLPSAGDRGYSSSTGYTTSTTSTGGDIYASDGSRFRVSRSDEVAVLMDGEFLDEINLICPAGVFVVHEIAQRVIRAGGGEKFIKAFANAPCDVVDSFLSTLRVECSRRTTEVGIKWWSAATKIIERTVLAMRRQLYAQPSGAFDTFRDDYLLTIASRILVLLDFADKFTSLTSSHEMLVRILSMYEALSDAAPGLLLLFSGTSKQLVSERTQYILTNLADKVRIMVRCLMAWIRSDSSHGLWGADDGVHPLTRYVMTRVEKELAPHRTVLGLILASGDINAPSASGGGAERVTTFGGLVEKLIEALERKLEKKPAFKAGGSSAHLFLANNISFVLNRAGNADLTSVLGLGDEWVARRRSKLEQHTASYVEASWGPVVACLETSFSWRRNKAAKALAKFNAAFKETHGNQACCEIPDPVFRAALRETVSGMVVPAYNAFVQKHPKLEKSISYTADDLAELLSEMFEGEAAHGRNS